MYYNRLIINSRSRNSSSTSSADCIYQFSNPFLLNTDRLKLKYFQCYNTKLTIDSTNNKIDFNENSTNKTATLTSGYYTASTLAAEVATQLTTASSAYNTFTASWSTTTRKLTISAGNAFTLLFSTGSNTSVSPFRELGFISSNGLSAVDSSTATSVTSPYPTNLSQPLSFYIDIAEFGSYNNKTADGLPFTFYIPVSASNNSVVEYKDDSIEQIIKLPGNLKYIDRLTFKMYYGNKIAVDLQNSDYEMVLEQV